MRLRRLRELLPGALLALGLLVAGVAAAGTQMDDTGMTEMEAIADGDITRAVDSELMLAPGVSADPINVETDMGIVTLSGAVDNILAKERAERIASMIKGVRSVVNQLEVEPEARSDDRIEKGIERSLREDPATESWEIDVAVADGKVTLTGTVDSWREKQLAARTAKGVTGVQELENLLSISYDEVRTDAEIKAEIEAAHLWDARLDDFLIDVAVNDGEVSLSGTVGSSYEKSLALADAWVPGVREVNAHELKVEWWARDEMVRRDRYADLTDEEIERAISDAFLYDPRVNSFNPTVEVSEGVATLSGVVDNLKARRAAAQDAANTTGVWRVKNYLKVRPVVDRSDQMIADAVRADLALDPFVDRHEIDVRVDGGKARLSGTVDSYFEKWQAEDLAAKVAGVVRVENQLDVSYEPLDYEGAFYDWDVVDYDYDVDYTTMTRRADWEIRADIHDEMFWSPFVDADQVKVSVVNGVATLTGTVDSWDERRQATEEALEGGAVLVKNELEVEWGPDIPVL